MLTPNDVFTPGQIPIRPTNVYAARGDAEELFRKALARGMIPVIYGEYGVGKTSMARHVAREAESQNRLVNIESVADKTLQDVFSRCLEMLGYAVTTKRVEGAAHIVLLGTSSDASRLVGSDPGIDRLLQEIHLKAMTPPESEYVVLKGMADLAIAIPEVVKNRLVRTCVGSPSILQYLALETAESAFKRDPRAAQMPDVDAALKAFVETKEARLNKSYVAAIESVGEVRYRKQVLRAMAECEDEYVTMEMIRTRVSTVVGREIPSTALSGPLRSLKEDQFGSVLSDVERPDGTGRLANYTTFRDPALKAFIRLQVLREGEGAV